MSRFAVFAVIAWVLVGIGTPAADAGSYLAAKRVATTPRPASATAPRPAPRPTLRLDGRFGLGRGPRRPFTERATAVVRSVARIEPRSPGRFLSVAVRGGGAGVGIARVSRGGAGGAGVELARVDRRSSGGLALSRPFGKSRFFAAAPRARTAASTARLAAPIPVKTVRAAARRGEVHAVARQINEAAATGDLDAGRAALASLASMRTRSPASISTRLRRYLAHRGQRAVARRLFDAGDLAPVVRGTGTAGSAPRGKAAANGALAGDARKLAARMALAGDADGAVQALELAAAAATGSAAADRQLYDTGLKLAVLLGKSGAPEQAIASVGLAVGAADRARLARAPGVRFARGAIEIAGSRALIEIAGRLRALAGGRGKTPARMRLLSGAADAVALAERLDGGHLKRRDRARMVDLGKRLGRPAMKGAREALRRESAADPFVGGGTRPVRLEAAR